MNKVLIGRYIPTKSLLHSLDPRSKLLFILLFVFVIFQMKSSIDYIFVGLVVWVIIYLSKIKFKFIINSLRPFWWIFAFTSILQVYIFRDSEPLITFLNVVISKEGIIQAVMVSTRFIYIIIITSLLTLTTTPMEVTDGLEKLLNPLKKLKVPVHEIAFMLAIALRFIPTLMDEAEQLLKAQSSRGMDFDSGSFRKRIMGIMSIVIPLFINSFRRAEDLSIAMEVRGYVSSGRRTRIRVLEWRMRDSMVLISLIVMIILLLIL